VGSGILGILGGWGCKGVRIWLGELQNNRE